MKLEIHEKIEDEMTSNYIETKIGFDVKINDKNIRKDSEQKKLTNKH